MSAGAVHGQRLLALRQASVRLGAGARRPALSELDLILHAGERVALVGPNGSGKSTLLRSLHGLQSLAAGQREVAEGVRMAMLFQRPYLLRLSVRHNLQLALWMAGLPWAQTRQRALQALARVELSDLAERPARALSGGQQQRVALARAWALQPDIWLLDEPTASLDPHAKREVEGLIRAFGDEPAAPGRWPPTLVFASHNLGQVKRLATRVVCLDAGQVLADLPVHDFFNPDLLEVHSPQASAFVKGETP